MRIKLDYGRTGPTRTRIMDNFIALACLLAFPMLVSCQNSPDPQTILKQAVEAHGGEKNINKPRMGVLKGKDKDGQTEATQEETFDFPKRWKRVTTMTALDGKRRTAFDLMVNGKLWQWDEGAVPKQATGHVDTQPHFGVLTMLLKFLDEKNVKLSPLKSIKVDGQTALGCRARWNDGGGDYYFDKKSHLLTQSNFTWQPEPGKEFDSKTTFRDYREIDGVKFPYRRTAYIKGGKFKEYVEVLDFMVTELRILGKLPDGVFSLPKKK